MSEIHTCSDALKAKPIFDATSGQKRKNVKLPQRKRKRWGKDTDWVITQGTQIR